MRERAVDLAEWRALHDPGLQLPAPEDFVEGDIALSLPGYVWPAQQPLNRVHRTCYLSTHPQGAFVEVFGRMGIITPEDVHDRVLSKVYLPSDARLADFTNPAVLGRFRITNALTMGVPEDTYPITQQWAKTLYHVGFSGIFYHSRYDVEGATASIALFGKPGNEDPEYSWDSEPLDELADEMIEHYKFRVAGGRPL